MERISKKDVDLALEILMRGRDESKSLSDDLSRSDCDIEYGRYLGLLEAIAIIKTIIL